jgi:SAM-dependent methyltransferase
VLRTLTRGLLSGLQYVAVQGANVRTSPLAGAARASAHDLLKAHRIAQLLAPGDRVLDIGCGRAERAQALRAFRPIDYTGLEVAAPASPPRERVVLFDGEHVPFEDKTFDVVMLCYVLHHMSHARAASLLLDAARVARRRVILLEDSMAQWSLLYRIRNRLHRVESDLAYASATHYGSPGDESMFLTHDAWRSFIGGLSPFRSVVVEPLGAISKYAHHTLIDASL